MILEILHRKLEAVASMQRLVRRRWITSVAMLSGGLTAALVVLAVSVAPDVPRPGWTPLLPLAAALLLFGAGMLLWRRAVSWQTLARQIEEEHPDLESLLLTAVDIDGRSNGKLGFLEERVVQQAVRHGVENDWSGGAVARGLRLSGWAAVVACALFLAANAWMGSTLHRARSRSIATIPKAESKTKKKESGKLEIAVTPGDVEVEKGSKLIVEAQFLPTAPADATLVLTDAKGEEVSRVPMRVSVDGKAFGGMIARVNADGRYHVETAEQRSDEFAVTTYVHPELERADATITPPEYAHEKPREIKNTLKITALDGSQVAYRFKVNKPVSAAELYGEDKQIIPLKPSASDPTVLETEWTPDKTKKYRLHLVDDKERSNKQPPWITVNVLANQPPQIELTFPKRDVQVSSIQEMPVEAKVWDDLAVAKSGAVFTIGGKSKEVMFDLKAPGKKSQGGAKGKQDVRAMLDLESEKAEPRQLVSYYLWAEDVGPKGEARRSMSDMFFAEVRHFEDIFREAEPPPSEPGKPPQKSQTDKLVELQKQVVNATWRLIRDTGSSRSIEDASSDVGVVRQSESAALDQVKEAMEKAEDAEIKTALTGAWKSMKDAIDPLQQAEEEKKRAPLNQALVFEQEGLEWLFRAQSREHRVMRQNSKSSQAGQQQQNERQLMNLELKQQEQRYEQEKQATEEQTAEQKELLQVLNRLKELARRQEALAEKIKELQKQIEKTKTDEERQQLADQLKRLQDEQEQLLRDLDEVKERMEKPDNQATMAEAREELEQIREQAADAVDQLKQERLSQAANSATRTQRGLEETQEQLRQKTARRFADEMKQMRRQAGEVAERQKQISEALENQKTADPAAPTDSAKSLQNALSGAETARKLDEQRGDVDKLLEDMRRLSEQAEGNEPLLSRSLYEAVRQAHTSNLQQNLEDARDQSRWGDRASAQDAERKAAKAIDELKKGVEKAAESVLGSEADALRMARAELDKLIDQVGDGDGKQQGSDKPKGESGKGSSGEESKKQDLAKAQGGGKPGERRQLADQNKDGQSQSSERDGSKSGQRQAMQGKEGKGAAKGNESKGSKGSQTSNDDGELAQQPSEQGSGGQQPGEQPGTGKAQGQEPTRDPRQGAKTAAQMAQSGGQDGGGGQPRPNGQDQATEDGRSPDGRSQAGSKAGGRSGDDRRRSLAAGGGGGADGGWFFDEPAQVPDLNPITGENYQGWTDRLRNVEELLSQPELRNEAARVLDNVRAMRLDSRRNNYAPQSSQVEARITQPLVELRDRVAEELAKRQDGNSLSPVDRDPVPPAYRDLVRRYYTELGDGK